MKTSPHGDMAYINERPDWMPQMIWEILMKETDKIELDNIDDFEDVIPVVKALIVQKGPQLYGSRVWFVFMPTLEEALAEAPNVAYDKEWALAAIYDLETGQEVEVRLPPAKVI